MRVGVLGAGGVGQTLAALLASTPGIGHVGLAGLHGGLGIERLDAADPCALAGFVQAHDAVASALPFRLNLPVAEACRRFGRAYFDFTEDMATTRAVARIAEGAEQAFVPQCGLAPGAVNILAAGLVGEFDGPVREAALRVGALPQNVGNAMRYALSWNAAGVVNQYVQPGEALHRGRVVQTLPLDGLETLVLDGTEFEAFHTSGGLATMCDRYAGAVDTLTYKTLRYPGHCAHMRFLLHDLNLAGRPEIVEALFEEVPAATEDLVVLYVSVTGTAEGRLQQRSLLRRVRPAPLSLGSMGDGTANRSATEVGTAAGMAAVLQLWAAGLLGRGFVRQDSVRADHFLGTLWGGRVFGA